MSYSSALLESAVKSFATLPGIGRKTALRLALHVIQKDPEYTERFANSLLHLKRNIKECEVCHNISDTPVCIICADASRNKRMLCLVESIRDVMAIEETQQFSGTYHILGGIISPIDGIGPDQLNIASLMQRVEEGLIEEVIMAINPTIEGETTIYYLSKLLNEKGVAVSTLARGVAFGSELEYADEMTIARSLQSRIPYSMESK